jgi:excisionase family DNA binding protein
MTDAVNTADTAGLLYGGKAIAAFLGITPKTAYHLIERGRLPVIRIARRHRLLEAFEALERGHSAA